MATRRPEPEGFAEDMDLLVKLEQERNRLQEEIDRVLLRLTVENQSPTATIAERLQISVPSVASRRVAALNRRERRERSAHAA